MYWGYTKKNTRFYTWGYVERKYLHKQEKGYAKRVLHMIFVMSGVFPLFQLLLSICLNASRTSDDIVFFSMQKDREQKRQRIFKSSFWNIKETGWVYFTTHNNLTTNMGQNIKGQGLTSNNSNNHIILLPGKNL